MADEVDHLENAKRAREMVVEGRRNLISKFNYAGVKGAETLLREFHRMQDVIDGLDRAIEDERRLADPAAAQMISSTRDRDE